MWPWTVVQEVLEEFAQFGEVARVEVMLKYHANGHEYLIIDNPDERARKEAVRRAEKRGFVMPDRCVVCDEVLKEKTDKNGRRTRRLYCGNKCRWKAYNKRTAKKEGKGWRRARKKK